MAKVVHSNAAVRRVGPGEQLELRITIGHAQTGQWWVKLDATEIARGEDRDLRLQLGDAVALIGKVLQVEVRCDDSNPNTDDLEATIELSPVHPALSWVTNNAGQQVPHGSMTSFIDIFIRERI